MRLVTELAIDLSQPGRGTMDIRACEIEVNIYGNSIAHERSFCVGNESICFLRLTVTGPLARRRRQLDEVDARSPELSIVAQTSTPSGTRVRRGRDPGPGACFVQSLIETSDDAVAFPGQR